MVRKNKNRLGRDGGGGEGGTGSGPSTTVSLRIPQVQESVPGESLKRPGFVSYGENYDVRVNHLKPSSNSENLYRYHVCMNPKAASSGISRAVVRQFVMMYGQSHLGGRLPAYDGQKRLYASGPFPFTSESFEVTLHDQEDSLGSGGQASERHERIFLVTIKFDVILSGGIDSEEFCQAFNTILRELSTGRYHPVGQSFYSPRLGEGLKNCCGFYQSIQCTQMGISLNIDISYKSFIKPLPVIDFVAQLLSKDFTDGPFNFGEQMMIDQVVRDIKVNVTLAGHMHRKYRIITGITSQVASKQFFHGTKKTVVQYFKEKYGYNIQLDLPCLKVGDRQSPTYLPIEACEIADGQEISSLLSATFQHPLDRQKTILRIVNPYNEDPYAKEFGVTFENKLTIIKGRVLPPPMLKFGDQGKEKVFLPKVGNWGMQLKKMANGGAVNTWTCINFASDIVYPTAVTFCDELVVMCLVSGMNFSGEPVIPVVNGRPEYVESALKKHHRHVMKILRPQGKELDLLIVILPNNNGTLYGDIKRICETDIGVVSQCCLAKHVFTMKARYLANIALKINVKVGGRNTVLVDAVERNLTRVGNTPTIIFGANVSHPHPGEGPYSPSIASVVASQDWPEVTRYAGLVRPQAHREEIIQCLFNENDSKSGCLAGGMIKEHLISFKRATGHIPGRIIFYRSARCTSSVSVVPPVYYAHLLASRARLYIKPGDTGELSFPEIKDNVKNSGMFFC